MRFSIILDMRKRTTKKTKKPLIEDKGADFIWAALSILSLPLVALSLTAMNWHPLVAFIAGIGATLAIVFIEAVVRGKLWIFQEQHRAVFGHQDTAFRILIVSGGILLFIQTFLILQVLENPNLDRVLLNIVLQKECQAKPGPLTHIICPAFEQQSHQQKDFALYYSLEQSAKTKLLPQNVSGACKIKILNQQAQQPDKLNTEFFALCATVQANGQIGDNIKTSLINAEFLKNNDGFYQPLVWQQDDTSQKYLDLIENDSLIRDLNLQLLQQKRQMISAY